MHNPASARPFGKVSHEVATSNINPTATNKTIEWPTPRPGRSKSIWEGLSMRSGINEKTNRKKKFRSGKIVCLPRYATATCPRSIVFFYTNHRRRECAEMLQYLLVSFGSFYNQLFHSLVPLFLVLFLKAARDFMQATLF